jgi:hypothetical protein
MSRRAHRHALKPGAVFQCEYRLHSCSCSVSLAAARARSPATTRTVVANSR